MRVLLTCSLGGHGHLLPVTALARAAERLGHDTLVVVPPSMAAAAAAAGLRHRVGAEPPRPVIDDVWDRMRAGPPEAVVGLFDRELFADRCTAALLPAVRAAHEEFRPDLVVREPCEYAGAVAAHEGSTPAAEVGISLAELEHGVLAMVAPVIDGFLPGVAAEIARSPYLSSFPASLDPSPWADTRRWRPPVEPPGRLPDWWEGDGRPLVYVTFGSVASHLEEAGALYRSAVEGLARLPVRLLLTVGHGTDPSSLGSLPRNVHVEAWVPQVDVFVEATLVVCHGGSGTVFGALAAGRPLVVCPLFADQPRNGELVAGAGAGLLVEPEGGHRALRRELSPGDVARLRAAVRDVLDDDSYRQAAEAIAAEMAAVPVIDDVLAGLLAT